QLAHHVQVQSVESGRPVQRQVTDAVAHLDQYSLLAHLIAPLYSLMIAEKSSAPLPRLLKVWYSCWARPPRMTGWRACLAASVASPRSLSIRSVPKPPVQPRDAGTLSMTPGEGWDVSELQLRPPEVLVMPAS